MREMKERGIVPDVVALNAAVDAFVRYHHRNTTNNNNDAYFANAVFVIAVLVALQLSCVVSLYLFVLLHTIERPSSGVLDLC